MKLLVLVLLISCSTIASKYDRIIHNDHFNSYIESYKSLTNLDTSRIKIRFVNNLKGDAIGMCYMYTDPSINYIEVEKVYWGYMSHVEKTALIYHELTHCVGEYETHDNRMKRIDGDTKICPASIMNSNLPNFFCLSSNWAYYKLELLTKI